MSRLAGHELLYEGAPFASDGERLNRGTGGIGHGQCSCGADSPELDSGYARKAWHREHKNTIREQQK